MAFLALVLIGFASEVAATIVRVAHEGGHMLAALISGHWVTEFKLEEAGELGSGSTNYNHRPRGWFGEVLNLFAGYATPPLAGLGGAYVIADGNSWGVLVIGVVLLLAVLLIPKINPYALTVTVVLLVGILWALAAGSPKVQAALAAGLVWLMLIGGLWMILARGTKSQDVKELTDLTWIPRVVWFAAWLAVAVASLWVGGRVLLGYA
jgi:hypothetical protein